MVWREQLGNVTGNNWKIRKRVNLSDWFFTQTYSFVEGSLSVIFCWDWQYCQYSVISGSVFYHVYHQEQSFKFYTKIKLLVDKVMVEIWKKVNTLKNNFVCVQELRFLNVPWKFLFCWAIYLYICNCGCTYKHALYIYNNKYTYTYVCTHMRGCTNNWSCKRQTCRVLDKAVWSLTQDLCLLRHLIPALLLGFT